MRCIICHNNVIHSMEILVLCTRSYKGLSAYHKGNDIIAMKKHLDVEHKAMYVKYSQEQSNH
jgi:hypothetical protein